MDLILIRSLSFNINIGSAQTYNSLSAQGNLQSNVWILMKSILLSNRMKSIFRRLKSRFCWKVVISAISLRISKWQLIQKINLSIEHCLVFIQTRTSGDHALAGSQDWTVFQIPNFLKISSSPGFFYLVWYTWHCLLNLLLVFSEAGCDEIQLCGVSSCPGFWKK